MSLLTYRILECDEEITVTSCYYTSVPLFPSEMNCELGINKDPVSVYLEENEKSWFEVQFDQAYDLESLKLGQIYLSIPSSTQQVSVVIWIQFSDGKRILVTVIEDNKSLDAIVLAKLIQTTSIKIGIDSIEGSLPVYGISSLEIFGCSLSK